jgi:excisionase family DNA binding protein
MAKVANSSPQSSIPRVLSTKEAAAYIGTSVWTLRRLVGRGEIPYIQFGEDTSPWKFLVADLDSFLARHRTQL